MAGIPGASCVRHPAAPAGWRCEGCGELCPDCVERVQVSPRIEYDSCVHCDGTAWPLLTPGSARSFEALLRHHWWGHVSWGVVPVLVVAMAWAELTLYVEHATFGVAALAASWLTAHALAAAFLALVQD